VEAKLIEARLTVNNKFGEAVQICGALEPQDGARRKAALSAGRFDCKTNFTWYRRSALQFVMRKGNPPK
jgi:hypothetical protein